MKKYTRLFLMVFALSFLTATVTSCSIIKTNNGKKKGWFKNKKNPHNPNTTNDKAKKGKKKDNLFLAI